LLGSLLVQAIIRGSRLKQDTALGIVLSTFFALGLLMLRYLQDPARGASKGASSGAAMQAGLDTFIYGQAAHLRWDQVGVLLGLGLAVLTVLGLCYKEFKVLSFDPEYTQTLGFRRRALELLLSTLIAITVIISLRAVGVVLTVGLLVAPAAAARQWTGRLGGMMLLAMIIGAASGVGGAIWSQNVWRTPTGPAVVLVASGVVAASLLLAPRRGLIATWLRVLQHRRDVRRENLLSDFYRLGERAGDQRRSWTLADLAMVRRQPAGPLQGVLRTLYRDGLVENAGGRWRLTHTGLDAAARIVRNHRLWELYLSKRLDLPADHVHRDAEAMEHALPPEVVAELEALLEHPERDPHGMRIPSVTGAASHVR
jgi:manganese/zinc/iron transport system permease protein